SQAIPAVPRTANRSQASGRTSADGEVGFPRARASWTDAPSLTPPARLSHDAEVRQGSDPENQEELMSPSHDVIPLETARTHRVQTDSVGSRERTLASHPRTRTGWLDASMVGFLPARCSVRWSAMPPGHLRPGPGV